MPREGEMYTAQEFVEMFLNASGNDKIAIAEGIMSSRDLAMRCVIQDHKGAMYFAQHHKCPVPWHSTRRAHYLLKRSK